MSKFEVTDNDEGLELAKRMAEEEEGMGRRPKGWTRYIIPAVAVAWSLFQLSIASFWVLDSTYTRAIHLGFAMVIVFLNYPLLKKARFGLKFLSATDRIPILEAIAGTYRCISP